MLNKSFHQDVWNAIQCLRDRMPHALLLSGQRGIGKLEFARALSAGFLCESPNAQGAACKQCLACRWFEQGNHPDFRSLRPDAEAEEEGEGAKSEGKRVGREITIDQVRSLDDFLHVGTHRQGMRIILVEPAEAMNRPAANALLKSLEEPAEGTLFLLVSHAPDRLLPTIRSRCRAQPMALPDRAAAIEFLHSTGVKNPGKWLALAGGAPQLASELASGAQAATLDVLASYLMRGSSIPVSDAAAQIDKILRAEKRGGALRQTIEWVQRWVADLAVVIYGLGPRYFIDDRDNIAQLALVVDVKKLHQFNRKCVEFKKLSEHPLNSKLFLEEFFLDYSRVFTNARPR